ncbi:MAG: uracil-DNA glycosylase, partial [Halanaerobium sp.]|nr:uracil-DNA glycosylase [Halanaerobium sp.]
GYSQADIMLIGEGPGREEDQQGAPFVGRAGRLLTKILAAAGLKEEELYISNVIKCRPRGNRTPERSEMQNCLPFLAREIELVQPVLVCLMGSVALRGVLNPEGYITRERGNWVERSGIYFIPTFHPAALLRDEKKKVPVWHDFQSLKKAYDRYRELKAAGSWPPE